MFKQFYYYFNPYLQFGTHGNDLIFGNNSWSNTIYAMSGNDLVYANGAFSNTVFGGHGHDVIFGNSATDRLFGGTGNDYLNGRAGHDNLYGGRGNDNLYGGSSNDNLYGGNGSDNLYGGTSNDNLYGGNGSDFLIGGTGNDQIYGGRDTDWIFGGDGADQLHGGDGDDFIFGGPGRDHIVAGRGNDQVTIGRDDWTGYHMEPSSILSSIFTNQGDDHVILNQANTSRKAAVVDIHTNDGNDVIDLHTGRYDVISVYSGEGDDEVTHVGHGRMDYDLGGGNDTIDVEVYHPFYYGGIMGWGGTSIQTGDGEDNITVRAMSGTAYIYAGDNDDFVSTVGSGSSYVNVITELGDGNDTFIGGTASDIVDCVSGTNYVNAGAGWNSLLAGTGQDTFVFDSNTEMNIMNTFESGIDVIQLSAGMSASVINEGNNGEGFVYLYDEAGFLLGNIRTFGGHIEMSDIIYV